jgi:polar amino acid transport system substrate-binding protein
MLVQQSFLVPGDSPINKIADIDQPGRKIAGTRNDSITLCLKRVLKQATPFELENHPEALVKALAAHDIDALGANRARLMALSKKLPGSRLLPDNFFNVPQNIIVPMGKPDVLAAVDAFIDDMRGSGALQESIVRSGVIGIAPAPKSPGSQHGCPG